MFLVLFSNHPSYIEPNLYSAVYRLGLTAELIDTCGKLFFVFLHLLYSSAHLEF